MLLLMLLFMLLLLTLSLLLFMLLLWLWLLFMLFGYCLCYCLCNCLCNCLCYCSATIDSVLPPKLFMQKSWEAVVGTNITLVCQVSSEYRPTVNWFKIVNGTSHKPLQSNPPILIENSGKFISNLTIPNVSFEDAGVYKCQARNTIGHTAPEVTGNLTVVERKGELRHSHVV